jgi:hypothetical protein
MDPAGCQPKNKKIKTAKSRQHQCVWQASKGGAEFNVTGVR